MGTMQLTEPQAGSDVGALRTRAERAGDGSYRITGQKIFITYGEHDLTDNIIHFVLARLPDAPPGTKGISLFLVPKFLLERRRLARRRNDVRAHSIEHKLGIHASPDLHHGLRRQGRRGRLPVGEENRGMACMFTMMNQRAARGRRCRASAIAERATQQALAYARERKQGRAVGAQPGSSPIIEHPDVKRMLLTMRALTRAARAICYATAVALDRAQRSADAAARRPAHERAALLTPVAKAFSTDIGIEVASLGVQVHGGMGYIEETGAAQHLSRRAHRRDLRRHQRHPGDRPRHPQAAAGGRRDGAGLYRRAAAHGRGGRSQQRSGLRRDRRAARRSGRRLERATTGCSARKHNDPDAALAGATPYLRLFALAAGGALLAEEALAALRLAGNGADAAPRASRSRASSPRTSRCRPAGSSAP